MQSEKKKQTIGVKKSVKLKDSETGTTVKIASSDTRSEVTSQKSKLTGKIRTGWI